MKKLILSITIVFCVMFSLTATASTSSVKETNVKFNSFSHEEYKTTGINQAELTKFVENSNSKITNSNYFGICFVTVSKPYLEEGMDGTLYVTVDITIRCYGVPGNDIIIVTQEQNP
ncbi:MAG: hypothetical protein WCP74_12095 [Sphingobacteriia bacterium]